MIVAGRSDRRLVLVFVHAAVVQVIVFMLRPTMSYRALELGVPPVWLGALSASFAVVPLALAIPVGRSIDRRGEFPTLVCGAALLLLAALALRLFGGSLAALLIASAVLGTGHLLSVVGEQALVANSLGVQGYDTAFGRYAFAASLGQTIGPGFIALFAGSGNLPGTDNGFVGAAGVSVLLLLITCPMRLRTRAQVRRSEERFDMRTLLRSPSVLRAIFAGSVVLSATDVVLIYLPALGTERGLDSGVISVLLVLRGAASMATRVSMGWLAGLMGRRRLMTASIGMAALATGFVAVPMPTVLLGTTVALAGFGLGVGQPLSMSWLAEVAPQGARGMAMSLRLTGNRLGQVVVPSLVGLVSATAGVSAVLCLTAAVLGSAGIAVRRLEDPPDPGSGG